MTTSKNVSEVGGGRSAKVTSPCATLACHPLTARFARPTIEFAARQRLPAIYGFRQWPEAGGLMSGSNLGDLAYRGAGYVDKILTTKAGAKQFGATARRACA